MADEPNKKMDAMLRAYIRKRTSLPETQLHPATRRMLQDEARRVHGHSAAGRSGWRAYFPRIAFAAAFCVVTGLAVVILNMRAPEQKLAHAEAPPEDKADAQQAFFADAAPAEQAAEPEAKQEAGAAFSSARELALIPPAELANEKVVAEASLDASALPGALAVAPEQTAPQPVLLKKTAASVVASRAAARPETFSRAIQLTNLGAARRTRFQQTNAAPTALLASFQVEQLGEQLRLVDSDGSVYVGALSTNVVPAPALMSLLPTADNLLAGKGAVYAFQATGASRTLGNSVVIHGRYFERTNLSPSTVAASEARARPVAARLEGLPSRRAIVGRAVIGGTNEVPVRALSVE